MKKILIFSFVFLCLFSVFGDVYKYTDSEGKVYLVDSIYKVPPEYRSKAEILPSGKEVSKQDKMFSDVFLMKKSVKKIGGVYKNFVYEKIKPYIFAVLFLFLVAVVLSFWQRDWIFSLMVFLVFFLVSEFVFLFAVYPKVVRATKVYSYLTSRYFGKSLSVADKVKKYSLENAVISRPVDLNPYGLYKRVDMLAEFYDNASLSALKKTK